MNKWIEILGVPSLISALVGGLMGYVSANQVDQASKLRSAKLDQIVRFTASNDSLTSGVSGYITAMAQGKDLLPAQSQLKTELSKQINESENLKIYFGNRGTEDDIELYQQNLSNFILETKEAVDPTKMVKWVGSFDKVLVSRKVLTSSLAKSVGIGL